MNDFLSMDIRSSLNKQQVQQLCRDTFPTFKWKFGESDYEGDYVSGRQQGVGNIQCYTDQDPMGFSFSVTDELTEDKKEEWVILARDVLAPKIGTVEKLRLR